MKVIIKMLYGFFISVIMFTYTSCNKTDIKYEYEKTASTVIEEKFFNSHRTGNPIEKTLVDYLIRTNSKYKFVEPTVKQIGFPRWDKMITSKKGKSTQLSQSLLGDSIQTFYIPFVRDSQNYVNASMIIRASPSDTSFIYRCDWQYANFKNDINNANDSAEHFAAFFMQLDKVVFGYKKFNILDSNLFRSTHGVTKYIRLDTINFKNTSNLYELMEFCLDVVYFYQNCTYGHTSACSDGCDQCYYCMDSFVITYCWEEYVSGGGGGGNGGSTGGGGGYGGGAGGSATPPNCNETIPRNSVLIMRSTNNIHENVIPECGGGWSPSPDDVPIIVDVISSLHEPEYPDISDTEPPVDLQSLFKCFTQIPDAGATFSIKLCVDIPVNGIWNAPFNLTHKAPGHTFLTLTKSNGAQSISQSVGFYPNGSGGNPLYPNAAGCFKNNGDPSHEYNAAIDAFNVSASQFTMVMNNLLSHENDTCNIFNNNCTTIALNAFNLLMTSNIYMDPFVVHVPSTTPQVSYFFLQSPQKLYKTIETLQPGFGLKKEYDVNLSSPTSTNVCP